MAILDKAAEVTTDSKDTTETTEGQPAAGAPKPPAASTGWAKQLSREAKLNQDRQTLKAEREAFAKEKEPRDAAYAAFQNAKKDPMGLLKAAGLTYDQITGAHLAGGKVTPELQIAQLQEEFGSFVTETKTAAQKREEAELAAANTRLEESHKKWTEDTVKIVHAAAEKYPFAAAFGRGPQVAALMEKHFEDTGKALSLDEAAAQVEKQLVAALPADLENVLRVPAVRKMVEQILSGKPAPGAGARPPVKPKVVPKTIDNSLGARSGPAPVTAEPKAPMSAAAKWQQRLAQIPGE